MITINFHKARILLFISLTLSLTIPPLYTLAQEPADSYAGVMPTSLRRPLDAYGKGPFCTSCHNMMYPLPPEELALYAGEFAESTEMEPGLKRLTWDPGRDVGAFYSPKGDQIVWVTDRFGNWTIWVMNEDGSRKKQLTSERVISGWPSWSPDGQEITYWSWDPASNSCDIWKMMADGSSKVQLTTDGNLKGAPKWRQETWKYTL
jgi:dipeptidyl aminopeptidase/acylaminoacyl peptidase